MCQSFYPDRPKYHGFEIMKAERRGDIIARLDACYRPPSAAEVAAGTERLKNALEAPAAAPAMTTPPPGLGNAKWSMLHMDDKSAVYFIAGSIKPTRIIGTGWFTTVFLEPRDDPTDGVSGIEFIQSYTQADCSKRLLKVPELAGFDEDGKMLTSGPDVSAKWTQFPTGTVWEKEFNLLCGKPQPLLTKGPIPGDHDSIEMNYFTMMKEKMHEALMSGGSK
jgi:hypothetical protein